MKIKWFFAISFLLSLVGTFYITNPFISKAGISCQPIYGGGQTCVTSENLVVDKKILNPKTKFEPNAVVNFQISIKNTSDKLMEKVNIKDIFPQFLNFFSGTGSFDNNTKTLTFSVDNLKANETRTIQVNGKIADADAFSRTSETVCVVNQVIATNAADSSDTAQDNAQFCIEKKVLGETKGGFPVLPTTPLEKVPSTGAESLVLFSLIPTGIAGWYLRKYSFDKSKLKGGEK